MNTNKLQRNLVYNNTFINYSNKEEETQVVYNHPDGWLYIDNGNGGLISYNSTNYSCEIAKGNNTDLMRFSQQIHEFPRWRSILLNTTISAQIRLLSKVDSSVTFFLDDGVNRSDKTVTLLANEDVVISEYLQIGSQASKLEVGITCATSSVVLNIFEVWANIGDEVVEGLPNMVEGFIGERKQYISSENAPANELSLCLPYYELTQDQTRLSSVVNGKFGLGVNGRSILPDMRGYFSRAWDNGASVDPDAKYRQALDNSVIKGDHVGTLEEDSFKSHVHQLGFGINGQILGGDKTPATIINTTINANTKEEGGSETRPKNIFELYTIKWA